MELYPIISEKSIKTRIKAEEFDKRDKSRREKRGNPNFNKKVKGTSCVYLIFNYLTPNTYHQIG